QPYLQCRGGFADRRRYTRVPRRSRASLRRTPAMARMTRPIYIDLPADHRRLVLNILRAHLPPSTKAWVFGSRTTGRAKRYSDLDLAIDAGRQLTLDETARLSAALKSRSADHSSRTLCWRQSAPTRAS